MSNGGISTAAQVIVTAFCFDGEWWGWENVTPRDKNALARALSSGVSQYHHYAVTVLPSSSRSDK